MGVRVGQPLVPRSGGGAASPLQIEADTASLYRALPANDKQTVGFCFFVLFYLHSNYSHSRGNSCTFIAAVLYSLSQTKQ